MEGGRRHPLREGSASLEGYPRFSMPRPAYGWRRALLSVRARAKITSVPISIDGYTARHDRGQLTEYGPTIFREKTRVENLRASLILATLCSSGFRVAGTRNKSRETAFVKIGMLRATQRRGFFV